MLGGPSPEARTPLSVGTVDIGGVGIVSIAGEFDLATADRLAAALVAPSLTGKPVVLNLSSLEFLDSTGLSEIVLGWRRLNDQGLGFVLLSPSPAVRKVLEMTGVESIIEIVEHEVDALRAVSGPRAR